MRARPVTSGALPGRLLATPLLLALLASACAEPPVPPAPEPAPPPAPTAVAPEPAPPAALEPARTYEVRSGVVKRNETIGEALGRVGVDLAQTDGLVAALKGVFDFRRSRPGDEFRATVAGGVVDLFEYRRGPVEEYLVRRDGERLLGSQKRFEIEKQVVQISATLSSSLYEAIQDAGEDPQLALAFADVFAWDIDFYNDPRKGDSFQLVVEKYVHEGRRIRYGELLAGEYVGSLVGTKRVFRYEHPKTGEASYFGPDGSAARRAFLKSPLKFANVTSRFGGRLHPVLKYYRQHAGVDYGAATGTPVWAVGDGVVTKAGWGGGCGNMVSLRHANGLETVYCHLSKLGEGVREGLKVQQKRVIGLVGTTGLSTGPHLHYAVKRGGKFMNPLSLKFPPAEPIPAAEQPAFQAAIAPLRARLAGDRVASASEAPVPVGP